MLVKNRAFRNDAMWTGTKIPNIWRSLLRPLSGQTKNTLNNHEDEGRKLLRNFFF